MKNILENLFSSKRYLKIRPTPEGGVLILVTLFVGLAAINTSENLIYLLFSAQLAVLIISAFLSKWTLSQLEFKRRFPQMIFAGTPAKVIVHVQNEKRTIASYSVTVRDQIENGRDAGRFYLIRIPPREEAVAEYPAVFSKRGINRLATIEYASRFPFGVFEKAFVVKEPDDVLVFPKLLPMNRQAILEDLPFGELSSKKKGAGHSLYGVHEFQVGDNFRHIHWRLSAKRAKPIVREFEAETRQSIEILLPSRVDEGRPHREVNEVFEHAVSIAATLAKLLIDESYEVGLRTHHGVISPDAGENQLMRILRTLALLQLNEPVRSDLPTDIHPSIYSVRVLIPFKGMMSLPGMESANVIQLNSNRFELAQTSSINSNQKQQ